MLDEATSALAEASDLATSVLSEASGEATLALADASAEITSATEEATATTTEEDEATATVSPRLQPTTVDNDLASVCLAGDKTWTCEFGTGCGKYPYSCSSGISTVDGDPETEGACGEGNLTWNCPIRQECSDTFLVCIIADRIDEVSSSFTSPATATVIADADGSDPSTTSSSVAQVTTNAAAQQVVGSGLGVFGVLVAGLSWL